MSIRLLQYAAMEHAESALITNDAVVLGMLALILGAIFYREQNDRPIWHVLVVYLPLLWLRNARSSHCFETVARH